MAQIIMVIDDNTDRATELCGHIHTEMGLETLYAQSGEEALRHLVNTQVAQPDAVVFNLCMNPFSLDMVRAMRSFRNDVQVIMLMGHADVDMAVQSLAHGASDFLLTPFHPAQFTTTLRNALSRRELQVQARHAWAAERIALDDIDAQSSALQATLFLARELATGDASLVLEGAPGTGHEMFARAIHGSSARKHQPFIPVNVTLLHSGELNRTLYGDEHHAGLFDKADGGTLFIRNVDSLQEPALERLLRVGKGDVPICAARTDVFCNARLIFAMHDAARRSVNKEKREMSGFFSALNAMPVSLPYLREIPEDIPSLAWLHCRRYAAIEGKAITGISPNAVQMLREISWPGNLEQLSQGMFNAVMCCQGSELQVEDFRYLFRPQSASVSYLPQGKGVASTNENARIDGLLTCVDETGNVKRLQEVEEELIRYALERYSGHMSDVARHLGIGRSTLYRKISTMDEK